MNETCWTLVGAFDAGAQVWRVQARRQMAGEPASVEADWAWTLAREETHGDVIGFWHTHPPGVGTAPSSRDVRTMRAWCSALGKPLLCLIAAGDQLAAPAAYVFDDDAGDGRPAGLVVEEGAGRFLVGP